MPPGPLEIKEKSYLTDAPPSDMPTNNVKLYQPRSIATLSIQHTCRVESCYIAAAATNMPGGLVLLSQTPLLFKHAYCWVDGCLLDCGHSISMPADLLSLNIACLLAVCFSICYACWSGVSLSAVPAGMVSHYQPCLLAWCFIIGHALTISLACWCCASL